MWITTRWSSHYDKVCKIKDKKKKKEAKTHHTFSTHTDTVGVFVGAPCPVVDQLLHVRHVSRFLGLAVQVTPLVAYEREHKIVKQGKLLQNIVILSTLNA